MWYVFLKLFTFVACFTNAGIITVTVDAWRDAANRFRRQRVDVAVRSARGAGEAAAVLRHRRESDCDVRDVRVLRAQRPGLGAV